ncbi:MAG: hypothetical protein WCV50_00955 [Patescibacteria group bacterium]|jgi:hypothetical protein
MKKIILVTMVPLAFIALLFISGCGEKTAEKAIETAVGDHADVDIDGNTVRVNTNTGSLQTGENVSLPSGFPSDVYVIDGTLKSAMSTNENQGYTVSITTSHSISDTKADYESKLAEDGWTISMSLTVEDGASIGATKDNRTTTISIGTDDGQTMVVIGTSYND